MLVLQKDFEHLQQDGFPGWELCYDDLPARVQLEFTRKNDKANAESIMKFWLTTLAKERFNYRNLWENSRPKPGETYQSIFYFATKNEAMRFWKKYNGTLQIG